jgi:hypothetical protein
MESRMNDDDVKMPMIIVFVLNTSVTDFDVDNNTGELNTSTGRVSVFVPIKGKYVCTS